MHLDGEKQCEAKCLSSPLQLHTIKESKDSYLTICAYIRNKVYFACWAKIPKNSDNKPWAYTCSKGFFAGLIFGGAYFQRALLLEGILHFKMGLAYE